LRLFTIGFTKKSAQTFFSKLKESGAERIVDVRLNNVSQLAGFAKKNDLQYFLRQICDMEYVHLPSLAPTQDILDRYKKDKGEWHDYEKDFIDLMKRREIETSVPEHLISNACLLCSEEKPNHCHRRLVAEYLRSHWGDIEIIHII
jgi:uncharacterized protein (DUF488 family)